MKVQQEYCIEILSMYYVGNLNIRKVHVKIFPFVPVLLKMLTFLFGTHIPFSYFLIPHCFSTLNRSQRI